MASPFELLLNVCTAEREALDAEKRVAQEAKKPSRKRHGSSETLSFEEIKALSSKALVEKYSKLTSDEMNKKYSYQCRLLPGKCNDTFKSYGNERKAWEKMKLHLNSHLKLHSSEIDFSVFAKSPSEEEKLTCSNALQKSPKKTKMEPQPSSSSDSNVGYEAPRPSRRVDSCPAKKMLEFNGSHKPNSRRKKYTPKPKSKLPDRSRPFLQSLEYPPYDDDVQNERPKPFYSDSSESEESMSSTGSIMDHLENVWSTIPAALNSRPANANTRRCLPDHDYAAIRGVKPEPTSDDELEILPRKKARRKIQKQFIIPTPKFPYLHAPEPYVVTEIVEIDASGNSVKPKQHEDVSCLDINSYVLNKVKEEKFRSNKVNFDMLPVYKAQDVTGSVLECVENKVNCKSNSAAGSSKVFKSYPSTSKDENSENVKKVRKELALKHIAQLNSKRKKTYQGPLQCQLCLDGRQFTAVASLMHHYRSHAGIKLFVCNICNDTFTRQHSLNYHMMIHQNQSRFCCEFCQRNFRHPSHFKEHLRRHTGETPFQCSFCNMLFKTRNTFKRHLRMQHKKILTAHGIEDDKSEGPSGRKMKKGSQ